MRVLLLATKSPWPPVGGGNVAVHQLVRALVTHGVEVSVLALGAGHDGTTAPYPLQLLPFQPRPWWRVAHHLLLQPPAALARFCAPRLLTEVTAVAARWQPDVIHVEQLHLAWMASRLRQVAPVLLRQQNVESLILERLAAHWSGPRRLLLQREAARLARAEADACRMADAVAAISEPDARHLCALAPAAAIEVLPVAYAPPPPTAPPRLAGSPPLICLGSFDWLPSRDGGRWLLRQVWPLLRERLPGAVLHLAGPGSASLPRRPDDRIHLHGVVDDPAALLDPRGVVLVPVRAGSGVRLRLLEAWAAGVPVVTTTVGGEGLVSTDLDGAALADTPAGLVAAVARVATDNGLRQQLIDRGRTQLAGFRPELIAAQAADLYRRLGRGLHTRP